MSAGNPRTDATPDPMHPDELPARSEATLERARGRKEAWNRTLCDWFAREQRDLPWRRTRDPYAIWISEAMLQQTRVEAVLGHYARFLDRLPSMDALAEATEEEVVALWSGLGYYRRARALLRAAQEIVREHGGRFPRARADALRLPGVGPYTAGAVLSIAYDLPEPLVDGNVSRVFARLFALDEAGAPLARRAFALASELVPDPVPGPDAPKGPRVWNQALMELGALVCRPTSPDCAVCPVAEDCAARRAGRVDELPRTVPRPAPIEVHLEVLWIERAGRVLCLRRPDEGRMAGMWELPTREAPAEEEATETPGHLWPRSFARGLARLEEEPRELARVSHSITHHRIRASLLRGRASRSSSSGIETLWVEPARFEGLALTGLTRKLLRKGASAIEVPEAR